ncbi:outer membrane protein assembly factor BamE [Xylophilus sp. ASV27]|uniref:outer membrane protein assembly factor BamE n=1 Tax=Xylophilus sp. ASV27 TaxID=2795129 RepID=UPI0018EA8147
MPELLRSGALAGAVVALCALLPACGSVDGASNRIASMVTPYKIEIVQGNFVSKEQVAALQKGMSRLQVREVLGTPLLTSIFHANRWDYVFTIKRPNVEPQARRLTVFFKDDLLDHFEGDEMPSEAEFVAKLDTRNRASGKVPVLEATQEQLSRFPASPVPPPEAATSQAAEPALPKSYPPLEGPASGR